MYSNYVGCLQLRRTVSFLSWKVARINQLSRARGSHVYILATGSLHTYQDMWYGAANNLQGEKILT